MKYLQSLPQKNQSFIDTRKRLNLSVPEFAVLLGISTEEIVLIECGKKLVYDWVYEKLDHISGTSKTQEPAPSVERIDERAGENRKYDINNPLLAIFKEVHAIQTKLNAEKPIPPKKKKPRRKRRTKKNPNQLTLMLAIRKANYPLEKQVENEELPPYHTNSARTNEGKEDTKTYLLKRVHTELNRFNKQFNHYVVQCQSLTSTNYSASVFFELKQIRDNFIRELFGLQKQITTEDLPLIEILSAIDVISSQYTDKMILLIKEYFNVSNEPSYNTMLLEAK